ncbi:MAG TPA: STAS domain-containing protein [Tepidisphaeraceae bacterium]|jgi:anti-sigma B factor antagonist|nr:STAS domain-containing protein [Tepidisphaeraceae bacterium]
MSVKADDYDHVCVLTVTGDLSAEIAGSVRKAVEDSIDQRQIVNFILDFETCSFLDSEGLSTILWIRRRADELFGQVKLVNLDENVKKILEITRLDHRFECPSDLATALKTMR